MTKLKKIIRRSDCGSMRDGDCLRQLVISLRPPNIIALRLKGRRKEYTLTTQAVYTMAVKAQVALDRKEKAKRKRDKKKHTQKRR